MKRIVLLLLLSTSSFAQRADKTENALKEIIAGSFDDIWSDLNAEQISKYYTEDFALLENGIVWNNDSIRNYTQHAKLRPPSLRENSFKFLEIKVKGKTAWLAYQNYATFTNNNKAAKVHWLESATAIKTKAGWKLQMLHSTRVKKH